MFILAVGIFGVGYLSAPEAVTVTEKETKVVTVQLPPKTRTVEKVEVRREPLAPSCLKFLQGIETYYSKVIEYNSEFSRVGPRAISEARKAIAGGDMVGTIQPLEDLSKLSFGTSNAASELLGLKSDLDLMSEQCKVDTKK